MTHAFYGLDHVQLAAPSGCEEQAREFFGNLLGMEEIEKPEELRKRGGVWFRCGTHQIHIGVESNFAPARKAHPAIHVRNLMALKTHLIQHGVPVKDDEALPGADRIYVDDPFGNRLELLEWRRYELSGDS